MQAYSRVGATDNGACPARHRGDRAHGRAGREQRSGPKQAKVAASGRRMVLARRRVALVRRRTASSRCMVAPARRVDAANDAKCPGDASAWLRRRDGQGGCPSGWHGDTDAWLGETARVRRAGGGRGVARSSGASQKGFGPSSHTGRPSHLGASWIDGCPEGGAEVGYQTSVTRVRLGSAGAVPFCGVGRDVSIHVRVVTPTDGPPASVSPASVSPASGGVEAVAFVQPARPTASARDTQA